MKSKRVGAHPGPVEDGKSRSISRDTQLRLQGAYAAGVVNGHDWVDDAELHETIKSHEFDGSDEAKRDRAWLRYYGR